MKKIIIIGSGITGLSAGWRLAGNKNDVQIFESDNQIGGLAKTIKFKNHYFDLGPHSFFSEDREIYKTVKDLFQEDPGELPAKERLVKMYFMKKYVDYPLSAKSILLQMGPVVPFLCFVSFLKSYIFQFFNEKDKISNDEITVKDWAINNFGNFLYKNFFKPYTEQFWKIPTEDLSHRVIPSSKKLDFAKTLKHLFFNKFLDISRREPNELNIVQRESLPTFYPKKGFGEIANKISEKIKYNKGKISLNEKVLKINILPNSSFEVFTEKKSYFCDIVISTIPLNQITKKINPINNKKKLVAISEKLEYLSLIVLNIITKKKSLGFQYCYYLHRPYNRVSNLNLFSEETSPHNESIFSLEISCLPNSKMWNKTDKEIYEDCIDFLKKDIELDDADIINFKVIKAPNVYPIYKKDYTKNLESVSSELLKIRNFYSVGRLGQFYYGDIDQMMRIGFDIAKNINHEK